MAISKASITKPVTSTASTASRFARDLAATPLTQQGGQYFKDGDFIVQINELELVETRSKGPALVSHFKVLESSNPEVEPGMVRDWYRSMVDDAAKADLKRFFTLLCAIEAGDDFDPNIHMSQDHIAQAIDDGIAPDQRFKGMKLRLNVFTKPQKNNPAKEFSVHKFEPYEA
jgi:hypothetical protein